MSEKPIERKLSAEPLEPRRGAQFSVAIHVLAQALHLPEDVRILGAEWDFMSNCLRVFISGPNLPEVPQGEYPQHLLPIVTVARGQDGAPDTWSYDWRLA